MTSNTVIKGLITPIVYKGLKLVAYVAMHFFFCEIKAHKDKNWIFENLKQLQMPHGFIFTFCFKTSPIDNSNLFLENNQCIKFHLVNKLYFLTPFD